MVSLKKADLPRNRLRKLHLRWRCKQQVPPSSAAIAAPIAVPSGRAWKGRPEDLGVLRQKCSGQDTLSKKCYGMRAAIKFAGPMAQRRV